MSCKRKKTSWSKFEYVFRNAIPQERKGKEICFCAIMLTDWWLLKELRKPTMMHGYLISICMRCAEVLSYRNAAVPPWNELRYHHATLKSVMVFSFLDLPGIIHCKAGMPSKGDRDTQVSTGLCCQCLWPPSKPPFTHMASCQIWSRYTRELTISHSELSFFLPLKDNPTFHVCSAKLHLTCNLKP